MRVLQQKLEGIEGDTVMEVIVVSLLTGGRTYNTGLNLHIIF